MLPHACTLCLLECITVRVLLTGMH